MDDPFRFVIYTGWAAGSLLVWGRVFFLGLREYRRYRDLRAKRELFSDFALLLVAASSAASIVMYVLFGQQGGGGLRGFVLAISLGGFLGAGIVTAMFSGHGKGKRK